MFENNYNLPRNIGNTAKSIRKHVNKTLIQ